MSNKNYKRITTARILLFLFPYRRLETTNQVSHDRYDNNALWLLGLYIPNHMPNSGNKRYRMQIVPVGYWSRDAGRKMCLSAHRTGNRFRLCVARSMVRLGT